MVADEVELRPVARRFRQVTGMTPPRVGWAGRKPFVDADIVKARLAVLELLVVFLDQLERRIGHFLVIVSPLAHETVRVIVHLGGVGNVVALP